MSINTMNRGVEMVLAVGTICLLRGRLRGAMANGALVGLIALIGSLCTGGVQAQEPPCDRMDIVLVVDATGGMKHVVREIRSQAADIVATATAAASDVRMGVVTFREGVFVKQDLTSDLAAVKAVISSLKALGGAAVPENWDGALNLAANRGPGFSYAEGPCFVSGTLDLFRPECRKLVILLTDAPPSGCNDAYVEGEDDIRAMDIADAAATNGVVVSTILSDNGDDAGEEPLLEYCACATGGTFAVVPDLDPAAALAIRSAISEQACPPVPIVTITDPLDGSTFSSGAIVPFNGNAVDYQGSDISPAINWFLNDDVVAFGTGSSASFDFGTTGDGVYTVTAKATDAMGTGSSEATITVGAPPAPAVVSVDSIFYAIAGKNLKITVNVVDDLGAPISGASVSINLLREDTLDLQASGTTGTDGSVTFQRNKAPAGTYSTVIIEVTAIGMTWDGTTPPNEFVK